MLFGRIKNPTVMTPHDGEFERIFPGLLESAVSKVEAARSAASRAHAVILLKGNDTVIAAPPQWGWRPGRDQFQCTADPGDGGGGGCAGRVHRRLDGPGHAGLRGGLRGRLAAWRCGGPLRTGLIAEDLAEILPESLSGLRERLVTPRNT